MRFVAVGCLAFVFLFLFDVYTLKNHGIKKKIFGVLGIILLFYSGIMISVYSRKVIIPTYIRFAAWPIFSISALLLVYSLFIELPFSKTYGKKQHSSALVTTGTYALCRHPGVLWFGSIFLFFYAATGAILLIPAGIIWTGLDILHVYLQEKLFFPRMFSDYNMYIKSTPMLLPTRESIQRCLSTLF